MLSEKWKLELEDMPKFVAAMATVYIGKCRTYIS
jgi:hypothetical protein